MAPKSSLVAALLLALVAAIAAADPTPTVSVTLTVPFGAQGVPLPGSSPSQAGFKVSLINAFTNTLKALDLSATGGAGGAPPDVPLPRVWTFDTASSPQTATVVFNYDASWNPTIFTLIAQPGLLFTQAGTAGTLLINTYGAINGNTVEAVANEPAGTPTVATPAAAPAASPVAPNSPPPPPGGNETGIFNLHSTIVTGNVPKDPSGRDAFQAAYFVSFANAMNTVANSALTLVPLLPGTPPFPEAPDTSSWMYKLIDLPNTTVSAATLLPPANGGRRLAASRRLLQTLTKKTAPPGKTWNVTFYATYNAIAENYALTYTYSSHTIVGSVVTNVQVTFQIPSLAVASVMAFINGLTGNPIVPPVGGYAGNIFGTVSGSSGRRLVERNSALQEAAKRSAALPHAEWAAAEASDVAYGTDKALYEIFTMSADYYTAGSFCAARGARLASYASEGSQIFVDILCDGTSGTQCWVEGNAQGACSAVQGSALLQQSCAKKLPFVCLKARGQAGAVSDVPQEAVDSTAFNKPTDVAFDAHRTLYEMFSSPVDYHTAGSVCLARNAQLANYASEAAQVFVDVLCEAVSGRECWVEGASGGACSSVHGSEVHQTPCTRRRPFVCTRPTKGAPADTKTTSKTRS